jgi:GT2 family glycosyltransferase
MTSEHRHTIRDVAIVAIGRNEGERLKRCIRSLPAGVDMVVYVDSGSNDGSVQFARDNGCDVVELDMSIPFTAARARNAGFTRLQQQRPKIQLVQFIDGDCELDENWIHASLKVLEEDRRVAVVCGRRREMAPRETPYNQLCDMEWNTPIGETVACGGDALMRVTSVEEVGGYDETLIAGEEPEMCLRLRRLGHRIWRTDSEMTRHDAQMTKFSQWWRRNVRTGYAYAEGYHRYGNQPEKLNRRTVISNVAWGLGIPIITIALLVPTLGWSVAILLLYGLLYFRILSVCLAVGHAWRDAGLYARFVTLGKFPQAQGFLQFHIRRISKSERKIIEYK